jgi:hypothetical protein
LHYSKRLAGSKGAEIDPNLPHANKKTQGSTRILYTWMDFFHRIKLCPSYLTFFHIPERSIALVKRLVQKELKLIPTCPTLTKVLPKVAHLYTWMDSFNRTNCAQAVAILPSSIFHTFNCTSKRSLVGSPKELKLIPTCPTLTKTYPHTINKWI